MPSDQQQLIDGARQHLADLYRIRSAPCDIRYVSHLHNCRAKLDRLSAFLDTEYLYRLELVLMRFERRRLKARFENHCRICGLYTGTIFRICECCMPAGHERQQESAQIKRTSPDLPTPRPRTHPEPKHPQNSSQRFLRRFGAGDTLATPNTTPRAMKNPLFTASAFPPAYVPSPKVAGGVFSSPAFRLLLPVVFRVAAPVTPPLCLIRETFPQKSLAARTVKGASNAY